MSFDAPTVTIPAPETAKQKRAYRKLVNATPEAEVEIYPEATTSAIEAAKPQMIAVTLKRHYRPGGPFEVVGYWQEEVVKKDIAGRDVVVVPREFIKDKAKPALVAGVGYDNKLWAGTVIKLLRDEAKAVKTAGIGEYELVD